MTAKYHFRPDGEILVFPNGDDWNAPRVVGTYKKYGDQWYACYGDYPWVWVPDHNNIPKHIRAAALLCT